MAKKTGKKSGKKIVEAIKHDDASRKNIPTAEYQSVMQKEEQSPLRVAYERRVGEPASNRNRDLDPQLVWRGKDEQDWSDLVVQAPPLYIQEKVHPKVLIDDLLRRSASGKKTAEEQVDLFADFNGLPSDNAKTEFYQHEANWSNRMILGDSLQVMASLAEREGLRGKVQCIYIDPPYGIKFNSNFQWSTTSRDVKDGNTDHITREPEQVKAFRDTWRDGIHSYLTYLRDRLTVARDLLTDSGSIFVQIGDENVHRVRALMDEVFGVENFLSEICFAKTTGRGLSFLPQSFDFLLWYGKNKEFTKYRQPLRKKVLGGDGVDTYQFVRKPAGPYRRLSREEKTMPELFTSEDLIFRLSDLRSQSGSSSTGFVYEFEGYQYSPGKGFWKSSIVGFERLAKADRLQKSGTSLAYRRYISDYPAFALANFWEDTGTGSFT
ncbi:site-specific DNA-methyltransferase, partial [Cytophagia bacterium CHB2]|nr:site-specific DNA-methyltransferase [Cytophagia bacterium CHB2]